MQRPHPSLRSRQRWLLSGLTLLSSLSFCIDRVQAAERVSFANLAPPQETQPSTNLIKYGYRSLPKPIPLIPLYQGGCRRQGDLICRDRNLNWDNSIQLAQTLTPVVPKDPTPSTAPQQPPAPPTPPPSDQLNTPEPTPPPANEFPKTPGETFELSGFQFEGNTAFSNKDLAIAILKVLVPKTGEDAKKGYSLQETPDAILLEKPIPISFAQLLQARSAITQLYLDRGYITSGAYIPVGQPFLDAGKGIARIAIVEGELESINVTNTRRLNPNYIRRRIEVRNRKPLNRERLLESLQLLRLNPLLNSLEADLAASPTPGKSILNVKVTEAAAFRSAIDLDNGRSPSVGSFRRGVQIGHANLLGQGDSISANYANTDGSNSLDLFYSFPLTPRNTTLSLAYGFTRSTVIEAPFDVLGIESKSRYTEITLRQPLIQTPNQDFAIGITASRRESETALSFANIGPFPLSPGADAQGRTRISALRFFQELTLRDSQQVLAFRSQFSFGLNALDSTINPLPPDSRFFTWRGQAQYVRLLAPDWLMLVRADVQLVDRPLLSNEQFGIGGQDNVRGYRQDALLTDNGIFASAEMRIPILRLSKLPGVLQLTPFVDFGKGLNRGDRPDPDPDTLLSGGLGLLLQISDRLTARVDYGIPFVSVPSSKRTLQEQGLYFSLLWQLF